MKLKLIFFVTLLALLSACGGQSAPEEDTATAVEATPTEETVAATEVPATATPEPTNTDEGDSTVDNTDTAEPESISDEIAADFPADEATVTVNGLGYIIEEQGSGAKAEDGNVVEVHYTGRLADGTVFDSSYDRDETIVFPLGQSYVIPGWEEGIALLNVGGKAKLIIPPELGYGEQGAGGVIPPNATLYFEVELLDIKEGSPAEPVAVDEADYVSTESGLKYYDIETCTDETPEPGKAVTVHYTGWLDDGTKFDSSLDINQPATFVVGVGQVIPGWDEGVGSMSVGCKRQIVIPPDLAYGEAGAGGVIPPDATLIFEVEMLDIAKGAPAGPTAVDEADYTTTDSGLKYYDIEEGSGDSPTAGQLVVVNYTGWLTDGTKFDSSLDRGTPFSFPLGQGSVIAGWDEGVATMKPGGVRQLVIPPDLGYGEAGAGGVIPPNATLIFEVEFIEAQ